MTGRATAGILALVMAGLLLGAGCGGGGDTEEPAAPASAARGKRIAEQRGCGSCHTTDGGKSVGPTWAGLGGSRVKLSDGVTVTADAAYLRRSISEPDAQIVDGFSGGMMAGAIPGGELSPAEIADLVAYLETL